MALPLDLSPRIREEAGDAVISRAPNYKRITHNSVGCALLAVASLFLISGSLVWGQQDERAVRAAYVFNLTKYVSWPNAHDRLMLGVIGEESIGPVLKQVLDGKFSDGRRITVVMHPMDAELKECDLLYVAESSPAKIQLILDRVGSRAVLTVGETDQFTRAGGMVGLVRSGDQIEIEVNRDALHRHQLEMSSRLLKLAVIVSGSGGTR
jgi:hypothetical protein